MKELLDDESLDPKKLFNKDEYSTVIIGRDGFTEKQNELADVIESLLDPNLEREKKELLLAEIKKAKAGNMLLKAIESCDKSGDQAKLIAACWECDLDFSAHFFNFVKLACNSDFSVAMEALTVIENCEEKIDSNELNKSLLFAKESNSTNKELVNDLLNNIEQRML